MSLFTSVSTREEPRYRTERLKQIVASMPPTIFINPIASLVLFAPFLFFGSFGHIPLSHLFVAFALLVVLSGATLALFLRYRAGFDNEDRAEILLMILQATLSAAWGVVGWLYWEHGNGVNNIYVTMIMVGVVWAIMYTRLAHTVIFLCGFVPLAIIFWLRIMTANGEVPSLLAAFVPVWAVYVVAMGTRGRRKLDQQLATQFANEDLQAALRVSTDEALRKRYEAEAANSAKTAFLANMSHELRTPLNAILGFSDIIAQQALGASATDRYAEYARDIHGSGVHLLSLINDLLDVAKIEAGKMEIDPRPLDAERLVENVERLMLPRARARGQTLKHSADRDLPMVFADERAMKQILLNLVSNAVKFTPEGGRIDVACRHAADGGMTLSVSDNGPGIAADKLDRVFQPFSQIDNRFGRQSGGTGLGLALVRGLAELHGGRAWIDSTQGEGTTVNVHFPLSMDPPAQSAVARG